MSAKTEETVVKIVIAGAIVGLLALLAAVLTGCAGSGPGGAWTPQDFEAVNRGVNDAVATYERVRYPDR